MLLEVLVLVEFQMVDLLEKLVAPLVEVELALVQAVFLLLETLALPVVRMMDIPDAIAVRSLCLDSQDALDDSDLLDQTDQTDNLVMVYHSENRLKAMMVSTLHLDLLVPTMLSRYLDCPDDSDLLNHAGQMDTLGLAASRRSAYNLMAIGK